MSDMDNAPSTRASAYRRNQWIEAGLFMRGSMRTALAKAGFEFTETKSWSSSVFRVKATPEQWARLRKELMQYA